MKFIDVETPLAKVRVRLAGKGPAVLLFHINRQSSALYLELIERLTAHFTAVAMDYPSYGESEHVRETPSIADYASCGVAVLDALSRPDALVAGEAVGSAVAAAFAARHPGRCAGLLMMNVPMMADRDAASGHIGAVRQAVASGSEDEDAFASVEAFLARNAKHAPIRPTLDWLWRVREGHRQCGSNCWQAADALLDFDLKATLAQVEAPATLLTGALSPFADFRSEVESRVKDLESIVLPNARFAIGWEKADEVAEQIGRLHIRAQGHPTVAR